MWRERESDRDTERMSENGAAINQLLKLWPLPKSKHLSTISQFLRNLAAFH